MNPPLRRRRDMEALREGLADGTIDMIATDHAPHGREEKKRGFAHSAMGITGLECAFPVLYTGLVKTGLISLEKLIALLSTAPAKAFGLECGIKTGAPADIAVFSLSERYKIDSENFISLGKSTPFDGAQVYGKCVLTLCGGKQSGLTKIFCKQRRRELHIRISQINTQRVNDEKGIYELVSNNKIADDMYLARFAGDTSAFARPGSCKYRTAGLFPAPAVLNLRLGDDWLDIAYKVVGKGTDILSRAKPGEKLDVLAGLGNGFDVSVNSDSPLLVGGGSGVPRSTGLQNGLQSAR